SNTLHALKKIFGKLIKIFLLIAICFCFLNLFRVVDMSQGTNDFIIRNFRFFFGFPASFAIFVLSLFGIILDTTKSIFKQFFFWISLLLIVSTLKTQSLFFAMVLILLSIYIGRKRRINLRKIFLILLAALPIAIPSVTNYFHTTSYSPRQVLILGGFNLSKQFFPFGSGFATFGSAIASKNYSPIYIQLGYNSLYGMGLNGDNSFLSDNFFAALIGELGALGILIFFGLVIVILRVFLQPESNKNLSCYCISMFISLIAINISSSFFSSATGALMMCILAVVSRDGPHIEDSD
ncbi:MAG: hypothetical protein ABF643_08830, partial [Oenococcus oeni]